MDDSRYPAPRHPVPRAALALSLAAFALAPAAFAQAITNAPVAPDTIYVGRIGLNRGISVIDLNGFGQSTGNPDYDPTFQSFQEGQSNFPNNPNVKLQGSLMIPALMPGTSTLDGGSAGVFTLTRNSELRDLLITSPALQSVGDMMLGHPLDLAYNNGPSPFGCQLAGGNLCLNDGKHVVNVAWNGGHGLQPTSVGGSSIQVVVGQGNPISFAPHPNPPGRVPTPSCLSPFLSSQEPTSILTMTQFGLTNLLAPGDPFGNPTQGAPPTGLLALEQNAFFTGPGIEQQLIAACPQYQVRQQIGHFLYVVDRVAHEVVVLNSNTFTVITRIQLDDPTELAMSPNLTLLAVTNRLFNKVSFIDIDPRSANFHQVVQETLVGLLPSGIAWDPGNEDVIVCNEGSNSLTVLGVPSLTVRKVIRSRGMTEPFAIAITPRQNNFGAFRNVYYAYIVCRNHRVALFESGPNTINGWGYDNIIGVTGAVFRNATAIQADPLRLPSGVWITHEGQLDSDLHPTGLGGGAVTNLTIHTTVLGQLPLNFGTLLLPQLRDQEFRVARSVGSDQLTGLPLDLAFDNQVNLGALPNHPSVFSPGVPASINGKNLVRSVPGIGVQPTNWAQRMFVAVRDPATGLPRRIDVIKLSTGLREDVNAFHPGTQSIPARGAAIVMDYFRQ